MRKSHLNRESNAYANEVANKSGPDSKVTTFAKKIDSYSNLMPNRQLANLPNETNMQMRKPSRPTGLAELAVPQLWLHHSPVSNENRRRPRSIDIVTEFVFFYRVFRTHAGNSNNTPPHTTKKKECCNGFHKMGRISRKILFSIRSPLKKRGSDFLSFLVWGGKE